MLVKINGKPVKLEYDFNAVCEIEDSLGKTINEIVSDKNKFGYRAIRSFFWGGMIKNKPGLEVEEAGEMLSEHIKNKPGALEKVIEQIFTCMRQDGVISDAEPEDLEADFENQETKKK